MDPWCLLASQPQQLTELLVKVKVPVSKKDGQGLRVIFSVVL